MAGKCIMCGDEEYTLRFCVRCYEYELDYEPEPQRPYPDDYGPPPPEGA